MKALAIFVNGHRICSIALTPDNVRSVDFIYVGGQEVFLNAGGMDNRDHVDWAMPKVGIGDEITMKVIECEEGDPPTSRKSVEEVDRWARSLRPEGKPCDDEIPPLPAPWE